MALAGQPCAPLLGDTPGNQAHVKRGPLGAGAGSCPGGRAGGSFTPAVHAPWFTRPSLTAQRSLPRKLSSRLACVVSEPTPTADGTGQGEEPAWSLATQARVLPPWRPGLQARTLGPPGVAESFMGRN